MIKKKRNKTTTLFMMTTKQNNIMISHRRAAKVHRLFTLCATLFALSATLSSSQLISRSSIFPSINQYLQQSYGNNTLSSSYNNQNNHHQYAPTNGQQQVRGSHHQMMPQPLDMLLLSSGSSASASVSQSAPLVQASAPRPLNTTSFNLFAPTFATAASSSRLKVNISNICDKHHMRVTIRFSRPFSGLIHTRDGRKKAACSLEGTGDTIYVLDIAYTTQQSDPGYCGVVAATGGASQSSSSQASAYVDQVQASGVGGDLAALNNNGGQSTLSVVLVVRLHKSIEFSDDRYFLLSCANRCPRQDCSSSSSLLLTASNAAAAATTTTTTPLPNRLQSVASNFVQSESMLVPTTASTTNTISKQLDPCDSSLRHIWLVRVCWLLTIGFSMLLFISVYLCLSVTDKDRRLRNKSHHQYQQQHHILHPQAYFFDSSPTATKQQQLLYSAPASVASTSADSSSAAAVSSSSSAAVGCLVDQNNNNNNSSSQLMMASALGKDPVVEFKHMRVLNGGRSQSRAGRKSVPRSKSQSIRLPMTAARNSNLEPHSGLTRSHREKCRSQTTIFYEQPQHQSQPQPHQQLLQPFTYLNAGFGSPQNPFTGHSLTTASLMPTLDHLTGGPDDGAHLSLPADTHQWLDSGAVTDGYIAAANLARFATAEQQQHPQRPLTCSQFDPKKSKQLDELLHQRHLHHHHQQQHQGHQQQVRYFTNH